ncbi:hypothetical protein EWI07_09260 [Sporolactobacillus sp. THM7-4]|nr:hypothetical protein EWI07_09260 [Sporolactobacillus sp. THM7-4]
MNNELLMQIIEKLDKVDGHMNHFESRMDKVEQELTGYRNQMDQKLAGFRNHIDQELTGFRDEMAEFREEMTKFSEETRKRFTTMTQQVVKNSEQLTAFKETQDKQDKILDILAVRSIEHEADIKTLKKA